MYQLVDNKVMSIAWLLEVWDDIWFRTFIITLLTTAQNFTIKTHVLHTQNRPGGGRERTPVNLTASVLR